MIKKITIYIILSFCFLSLTKADNIVIQGQVSNNQNYVGIENHAIYITDNIAFYDTIYTGANGYYIKQLFGITTGPNLTYFISTKDCNNTIHLSISYSMDSLSIINFSICDTTAVNCQNSFTYSKQNLAYTFSASNPLSFPTLYNWSFSDGGTASGQNVSHTFQQPVSGQITYTVILNTVTLLPNLDTCQSQSIQYIHVLADLPRISGTVSKMNAVLTEGYVLLYGINNPLGSCLLLDSINIDNTGFYYFNKFSNNHTGYLVKAVLPVNSSLNSQYISTYYNAHFSWEFSLPIIPDTSSINYNINLIPYQALASGNGNISGNVSQFLNTTSQLPVSGIDVLLLNQQNQPLRLIKTDFQGNFIFPNLPYNNYKLYVEKTGKISQFASVTLNALNPTVNNINFLIKHNNISVSAEDATAESNTISDIYPNPSYGDAYLDIVLKKSCKIEIVVINQLGQILYSTSCNFSQGHEKITLNTHNFKKGIYTVKLLTNDNNSLSKKLVILK